MKIPARANCIDFYATTGGMFLAATRKLLSEKRNIN